LWDLNYDRAIALNIPLNQAITQIVAETPSFYQPYKIGELILHSGHILHQAAAGINLQPQDERITIQGHGVFSQGSWHLYW
jgi:arginine/lysine/ornithine decarboxylase